MKAPKAQAPSPAAQQVAQVPKPQFRQSVGMGAAASPVMQGAFAAPGVMQGKFAAPGVVQGAFANPLIQRGALPNPSIQRGGLSPETNFARGTGSSPIQLSPEQIPQPGTKPDGLYPGKGQAGKQPDPILRKLKDPNALVYTQVNGKLFVMPASHIPDNKRNAEGLEQAIHFFHEQGADVTTIYLSVPGDPTYSPLAWYAKATQGGKIDVWSSMLNTYAQAGPQVQPKPWNPGKEPPGMYIGNDAHREIAGYYRLQHGKDEVALNDKSMAFILELFNGQGKKSDKTKATPKELSDKPDITNISTEHLYEIKPHTDAAGAESRLAYYTQIFLKVGIPIQHGPSADPGVIGTLPSPAGIVHFFSPKPGIILYKRQNKPKQQPQDVPEQVPLPFAVPQTKENPVTVRPPLPEFAPESNTVWDLKYWEELTGLTGAALIVYLIISEGSRLFPPRNLIPVP